MTKKCIEKGKPKFFSSEKEMIDYLEKITQKQLCNSNGNFLSDLDFEKIDTYRCVQTNEQCLFRGEQDKSNTLKELERLKSEYEDYLNSFKINSFLELKRQIRLDNKVYKNKLYQDYQNDIIQTDDYSTSTTYEIIKEINLIKRIDNEYKRDRLIENLIKEKLRLPFENEDPDFFYDSKTGCKALSKHWQLKVKITSEPQNSSEIINELIIKYGVSKKGSAFWICRIDGDQLALKDYDSFEGYDDDGGGNDKKIREVLEETDNNNLTNSILEFNETKTKIFNTLEDIHEVVSLFDNSLFTISKQQLIVEDIYEHIKANYFTLLQLEYKKKPRQIAFSYFLNYYLEEKSIILLTTLVAYAIYFQTHLPIIKPPNTKFCKYTLSGDPYNVSNEDNNSFIDYFSCIIYHHRYIITKSEKVLFLKFQNMSQEDLSSKIKLGYIKFGKERNIENLFKKWSQYVKKKNVLNSELWSGFKPNFKLYNKGHNPSQRLLLELDKKLNLNDSEFISNIINKLSVFYRTKEIEKLKQNIIEIDKIPIRIQFSLKNKIIEKSINNHIYPDRLTDRISLKILDLYSHEESTFGQKKMFNKYGICVNTGSELKSKNNADTKLAERILKVIKDKNSYHIESNTNILDLDLNNELINDLISSDILKDDVNLLDFHKNLTQLYLDWTNNDDKETSKEDITHKLKNSINDFTQSIKESFNNKTYHQTEFLNLNSVISKINDIFDHIYLDYNINLYSKAINELIKNLSFIKNRKQIIRNNIPKKWDLDQSSVKILNEFITKETDNEGKMLVIFSKRFKNDPIKIKLRFNNIIQKIKKIQTDLGNINGHSDLIDNIRITKFSLYQKFLIYKYSFFKTLLFLSDDLKKDDNDDSTFSFIYTFLNNIKQKYESYYFTREQIRTKRAEEREEENNLIKNRKANMSEERKQIDNFEQKMRIGFYAKSGKFEFQKGFNQ